VTIAQGWQPHCHLWADCLVNVGTSTSHNPMHLLCNRYRDSFTFSMPTCNKVVSLCCRHKPAIQKCNVYTHWVRDDPPSHADCVPCTAEEARKGTRSRPVLMVRGQNWGQTRRTRGSRIVPRLALQRHHQQALGCKLWRCERPIQVGCNHQQKHTMRTVEPDSGSPATISQSLSQNICYSLASVFGSVMKVKH
jgi:hypothetical protein